MQFFRKNYYRWRNFFLMRLYCANFQFLIVFSKSFFLIRSYKENWWALSRCLCLCTHIVLSGNIEPDSTISIQYIILNLSIYKKITIQYCQRTLLKQANIISWPQSGPVNTLRFFSQINKWRELNNYLIIENYVCVCKAVSLSVTRVSRHQHRSDNLLFAFKKMLVTFGKSINQTHCIYFFYKYMVTMVMIMRQKIFFLHQRLHF